MEDIIIRVQGLLELSVLVFFLGLLIGSPLVTMVGGLLMVIDDLIGISIGALNPIFPIMLALVLAVLIQPWYLGVFWSMAVFNVLSIPTAFAKIINGSRVLG